MPEFLRLGDHCLKIGSGTTPRGGKDSYLSSGPYRLIRSQNVYNSGFSREGLVSISEEQAAALSNAEVLPGDILLNITGDSVARTCQVDDEILPARVNQHVAIIRPDPRVIDPRFLRFYLVSPQMQSLMLTYAGAGATRNALTKGMIENFKIPRFHIAVQRKIGATLGVLEDKIELNRRMNETLEAMAQAIFRDWFVDFGPTRRKLAGITDPVEIMGGLVQNAARAAELAALFPDALGDNGLPEGWEERPLKSISSRISNGGTPSRKIASYWGGNIPWLSSGEVRQPIILETNENISEDGLLNSSAKWVKPESSLVALYGATAGQVSYAAVRLTTNQAICSVEPKPGFRVFIQILLRIKSPELLDSAIGSAQQNISKAIVEAVIAPPHHDMVVFQYEAICGPVFNAMVRNLRENHVLAATRDLLLPKLMSGEIRLREAEEIAEAAQ